MSNMLKSFALAVAVSAACLAAPAEKSVEGTVTNWNDATSSFQTKATVETWTFSFDKAKLQKVGAPAVGSRVKINYHMNGKAYVADKVEVVKKSK